VVEDRTVAAAVERPLAGKVALVTGAGGALGRAIAATFAAQGARVFGVDLAGDVDLHADVGTAAGNQEAVAACVAAHGQVDHLVLNAGVQRVAPIADFPPAEWDRLLAIMLSGPFLAVQAAWPQLTRVPGGRILVTASTSSFVAEPGKSAYVAAKHGVLGLVKVAALEGGPHGLTANAVAPSWVRTPLVEGQVAERAARQGTTEEEAIRALVDEHAVPRFVEAAEVAATLAFLAAPAAAAITGACVPVDLGALAR
jgi:3-hydroxybutyrate dehydrogenase